MCETSVTYYTHDTKASTACKQGGGGRTPRERNNPTGGTSCPTSPRSSSPIHTKNGTLLYISCVIMLVVPKLLCASMWRMMGLPT